MTATPVLPQALKTGKRFLLQNIQVLPDPGSSPGAWGCGRAAEGSSAFSGSPALSLLSCGCCCCKASLPPPPPPGLPEGQLQVPEDSWESGASLKCSLRLAVVPQNVSSSYCKIKGSLAWPVVHIILYPTPLFFLLPPTQQIKAPCARDTASWAQPAQPGLALLSLALPGLRRRCVCTHLSFGLSSFRL